MDNPLMTLRSKYAEDLEEILTCPVCFERLTKKVPVCTEGHHICSRCLPMMNGICPVCKEYFNGTRNYLAESLIVKFDEIKDSLLDPHHVLNQTVMENKTSTSTQTDKLFENASINSNHQTLLTGRSSAALNYCFREGPVVGKGKYPCRIGSCIEELPHGGMIPHLRYYHKEHTIEEKMAKDGCYQNAWEVEFKRNERFDRAISISNMGLFFVNITIDEAGDLHGSIQIANTTLVSQLFTYEMSISHSHTTISYRGKVIACRSAQAKLWEKCFLVNNSFMAVMMKGRKTFTCSIVITRHIVPKFTFKKGSNKEIPT